MLNIHHLELFYYVAHHGGISQAVRNMPYGIQQPAVSAQVIALEDHLGVTLFRRRPFELTGPGRELFAFIEPFFSQLPTVEAKLQGDALDRVRVGASQTVLREHLPAILRDLRRRFPHLKLVLRSGYQHDLEESLAAGEIELAVTVIDRGIAPGLQSRILVELPLALLVPKSSPYHSAKEILSADRIAEPLICLRPSEAVPRMFQQELVRRGLAWMPTIEAGTLELVETYAAEGFGVGLTVAVPGSKPKDVLRSLSLDDFPRLPVGLLWTGTLSPVARALADLLHAAAKVLAHPASSDTSSPAPRAARAARGSTR